MRVLSGWDRKYRYWWSLQFILLSLLVCGSAFAVTPTPGGQADSSRAIKINLKELEPDSSTRGQLNLFLVHVTSTDDIDPAWGAAIAYDYVKFDPVRFRIGIEASWSKLDLDWLGKHRFVSIGIDGSVLLAAKVGRLSPYAGVGLTAYFNYWPRDEGPKNWIGPYDDCDCASTFDYGNSAAGHVRTGALLGIGGRASIVADFKYTYSRPTTDLILVNDLTGEESDFNVKYDRRVLSSLLGISVRF